MTANLILSDRITSLVEEDVHAAIRIGHLPDASYSAIKVGTARRVIRASPAYLEKHGVLMNPQDLTEHRIIGLSGGSGAIEWRFGNDGSAAVQLCPRLYCNLSEAAIGAARSGGGLTRVLSYQVGKDLAEGKLKVVWADHEADLLPVHVVHSEGRNASAKVRAFVDHAFSSLRANKLFN